MLKYCLAAAQILLMPLQGFCAATFFDVDTNVPFKCQFSCDHHNRILVDKSRVHKIIYPEENLSIRLEDYSGQAFIYALSRPFKPITLAVVTESGLVQDLEVEFTDCAATVVVLREPQECLELESDSAGRNSNSQLAVRAQSAQASFDSRACIEDVLQGYIPAGYIYCSVPNVKLDLKGGLQARVVSRFDGTQDTLYLYEIMNTSRYLKSLFEWELECEGSRWVFLEQNCIEPNGKLFGIVCIGYP